MSSNKFVPVIVVGANGCPMNWDGDQFVYTSILKTTTKRRIGKDYTITVYTKSDAMILIKSANRWRKKQGFAANRFRLMLANIAKGV